MSKFSKIILAFCILTLLQVVTNCQKIKNGSNEKGIDYLLQGKLGKAESEFANVADPDSITEFYLGLITYIDDEDLDKEAGVHLLMGIIYSKENKTDEAIDELSKVIKAKANLEYVYVERGALYYHKGNYLKALEDYTKAITLNSAAADNYYNRGITYASLGNYVEAIRDYTKALKINPEIADYYYNRGLAYYLDEYYAQSILDYTNAIKFSPKDHRAYNNRGLAYLYKGMFDEAINDFAKAIELNPKNIDAYNSRAYLYITVKNDKEKACADWKKACELGDCENYNIAKKNGECH